MLRRAFLLFFESNGNRRSARYHFRKTKRYPLYGNNEKTCNKGVETTHCPLVRQQGGTKMLVEDGCRGNSKEREALVLTPFFFIYPSPLHPFSVSGSFRP